MNLSNYSVNPKGGMSYLARYKKPAPEDANSELFFAIIK